MMVQTLAICRISRIRCDTKTTEISVFGRQPPQHFEQPFRFPGGEVGGGLIEEKQLRAGFQGARDLDQLLLVQRQPADLKTRGSFANSASISARASSAVS